MNDKLNKNQIESLLKRYPEVLSENNPSADWWKEIKSFNLPPYQVIPWIIKNLENSEMVKAFVEHPPEGKHFIDALDKEWIDKKQKINEPYKQAWELIIYAAKHHEIENYEALFSLKKQLEHNNYGQEVRSNIVSVISPSLKIDISLNWISELEEKQQQADIRLYDLMDPRFKTSDFIDAEDILKSWNSDIDTTHRLCRDLTNRIIEILEFARENEIEHHTTRGISSIEKHEQDNYSRGCYKIMRLTVGLWDKLRDKLNEDNALKISSVWEENKDLILMQRMFLYALTKTDIYSGKEASETLCKMNDNIFWDNNFNIKKEIASLLEKRWNDFPVEQKQNLEKRIIKSCPRNLFRKDLSEEDWERVRETSRLKKFRAIKNGNGELSQQTQEILTSLEKKYSTLPDWQTYFDSFMGPMITGTQGAPALLDKFSTEERIDEARELQQQGWDQSDIWRNYCSHNPKGAFEALQAKAQKEEWPEEEWGAFFWGSEGWKKFNLEDDSARTLVANTVEAITKTPVKNLEKFVDSASHWMEDILRLFDKKQQLALWHKMMDTLEYRDKEVKEQNRDSDYFTQAINRAEGRLTAMVFSWWKQREKNQGFEEHIAPLMDRLIKLENYSGALIRSRMMTNLDYIYHIAPDWTEKNIIPYLQKNEFRDVLWDGYKYSGSLPTKDLFAKIKPAMLDALRATDAASELGSFYGDQGIRKHLAEILMLILLFNEGYDIDTREMKQTLREVEDGIRELLLDELKFHLRTPAKKEKEEKEEKVAYFFGEIWPLDAKFITDPILSSMVDIVLDMEDAFPKCLEAIKDFLQPIKSWHIPDELHRHDDQYFLPEKHPEEVLELLALTINRDTHLFSNNLPAILKAIKSAKEELARDTRFLKLQNLINK